MNDILHGLNRAQRDAVTSSSSVLQVLAPPGSGKTKTLTARVAYLLAYQNLKPWNLIVCTFTVKAANEMKARITKSVGNELSGKLKIGTFHSIALRYLKQYGQHIGLPKDFGVADSSDSIAIVKRIVKQNRFSIDASQARSRISAQKAKGIDSERFTKSAISSEQQEFGLVYAEYEATLKASNLLDFDDLLSRCCFLIESHPQCVSNIEAVLVDEFQDTNNIQYRLMGLFAQHRNTVTIVGDPDQSIYGFRSAEKENLGRMKHQWPDTVTINLEENYRSSGAILLAAQHIIEQDQTRPQKRLQATHSHGLRPILRKLPSAAAEAEWLVAEIKRLQALTGNMLQANDFAVLLRSASLSRFIESALGQAGVPYRMVGGTRFYDRAEIKLILDYLRVVDQPSNSEAVQRIVNVPSRRIGDATIKALIDEAQTRSCALWTLIHDIVQSRRKSSVRLTESARKGLTEFAHVIVTARTTFKSNTKGIPSLVGVIELLIRKLALQKYLKQKYPEDYDARWANVEELYAQAADASDLTKSQTLIEDDNLPAVEGLEQRPAFAPEDALSAFLANIALTASSEKGPEKDREISQVTISTIHAAKGLEWPVVFIPACYEGSIPHSRADDHDEERRLLYVGMTRAQAALYLSIPIKNSQREETSVSTFLQQPGVSAFFEEHGPSLSLATVVGLAQTLRRERPSAKDIETCKDAFQHLEDNYWPLNGDRPLQELTERDNRASPGAISGLDASQPTSGLLSVPVQTYPSEGFPTASATNRCGFVSVAAKYQELMEQSALQKVDKRADRYNIEQQEKPNSRKRQIEGQGAISNFFAKRARRSPQPEGRQGLDAGLDTSAKPATSMRTAKALQELDANSVAVQAAPIRRESQGIAQHKLRNAPLSNRPSSFTAPVNHTVNGQYVFVSSSSPPAEDMGHPQPNVPITSKAEEHESAPVAQTRPAATLHTTSMQKVASQRRTLGMRRSLNGWSTARGNAVEARHSTER